MAKARILVVEDSPTLQLWLKVRLEYHGYTVIQALDGKAGLKMVKSEKPDVVLLDVMMPEMDGIEVCRRIKSDPEIKNIPVIFLSAKAQQKDIDEGLAAGAEAYITKPYESDELLEEIEKFLKKRGK